MKSALEIAHEATLRPITEIAAAAGIQPDELEQSGQYRGKVRLSMLERLQVAPERQAGDRDRHHADQGGRGQDHDQRRADDGPRQGGQEGDAVPARAVDGPGVRRQGRRHRRRLLADRADGGHQPPLQRRLPRRDGRAQPAGRGAGRLDLQRQPAGHRPVERHLAAHRGHERPRAALLGGRPRRQGARRAAREPVRHHRGVGGDGGVRAGERPQGPAAAARAHRRRIHLRRRPGDGGDAEGGRRDDGGHEGRHQAEHGPDAGGPAGAGARRPVRQHRARRQLDPGRPHRAQSGGLRGDRGGLRERPRASRSSATSSAASAASRPARRCW